MSDLNVGATMRDYWQRQLPAARLDIFPETIVLTKFLASGKVTHPVALQDLVAALADLPVSTGILPKGIVFAGRRQGAAYLAIHVPAGRWKLTIRDTRTYTIPMPAFVFCGHGTHYRVFAVTEEPFGNPGCRLYHAPCPNVYPAGNVCPGDAPWPVCSGETIEAAFKLFIEGSAFNHSLIQSKCRSHPASVLKLWDEIEDREQFPEDELIPMNDTLRRLL